VEESSLAARYCVVLEELRREAIEQIERSQSLRAPGFDGEVAALDKDSTDIVRASNGSSDAQQSVSFGILPGPDANFDFDMNLETSLADFSDWIQFESMASPRPHLLLKMIFIILTNRGFYRRYPALQILV
jgi:hypothetical protein